MVIEIGRILKGSLRYILYGIAVALGFVLAFLNTQSGRSHSQLFGDTLTIGDTAYADAGGAGGAGCAGGAGGAGGCADGSGTSSGSGCGGSDGNCGSDGSSSGTGGTGG
ncbi:MAG: hypothetical protein Q8R25_04855 [bacterium]|nr:hypothetical protein [bacterium]